MADNQYVKNHVYPKDELGEANAALGKALQRFGHAAELHGVESDEYAKAREAVHAAQDVANRIAREKKAANLAAIGIELTTSLAKAEKAGDEPRTASLKRTIARHAIAVVDHAERSRRAAGDGGVS